MILIDTHAHLYLEHFDSDRKQVIENAINNNVKYMLLPNIDSSSIDGMLSLCNDFPENFFPMMGLHPTSVKEDFEKELKIVESYLGKHKFYAIGETGIDLYWDKTFIREQEIVFRQQIDWAIGYGLPIVIHSRNSFDEIIKIINEVNNPALTGVFHCFGGSVEQAKRITDLGFKLGIGGIITYKNSGLEKVVSQIDIKHMVLETDSPFLPPVPFRSKRNESAYVYYVAEKISLIKNMSVEEVAKVTTDNANELFKL